MIPINPAPRTTVRGVPALANRSRSLGIDLNGTLFNSLINGLYSNKIAAPIRELMTNAEDASPPGQPFRVHLPTHLSPVFSVRDFGSSMTREEVNDLYSVLGRSSKRTSNDQVGMLGLGSKSPFAYTSRFSVTCWQSGHRRTYAVHLSGDLPQIILVDEGPSHEPDGTEVSFAVNPQDIQDFLFEFCRIVEGFPTPPQTNIPYRTEETLFSSSFWRITTTNYNPEGFYIRQGCVIYPVSHPDFPRARFRVVIDVPIGSVSVSTSREGLGYDPHTVSFLSNLRLRLVEDVQRHLSEGVAPASDYWEACDLLEGLPSPLHGMMAAFSILPVWRQRPVNPTPDVGLGMLILKAPTGTQKTLAYKPVQTHRVHHRDLKTWTILHEPPSCRKGSSRVLHYIRSRDIRERPPLFWTRMSRDEIQALLDSVGPMTVIDVGSLPTPPTPSHGSRKKSITITATVISVTKDRYTRSSRPTEKVLVTEGQDLIVSVLPEGRDRYRTRNAFTKAQTLVRALKDLRGFRGKVHVINSRDMDRLRKIRVRTHDLSVIANSWIDRTFGDPRARLQARSEDRDRFHLIVSTFLETGLPVPETLRDIFDRFSTPPDEPERVKSLSPDQRTALKDLCLYCQPDRVIPNLDYREVSDIESKLQKEFPLINHLRRSEHLSHYIRLEAHYIRKGS